MIRLRTLKLQNIGRFVDEQTIDFSSMGNLIQVDGKNQNTQGSSGSGKSTIFNALQYLLGLDGPPTTVLQSRLTKESISVTGHFDFDGKDLTITRSKKGLSLDLDGQITEGSSKLAEEKLDEILKIPRAIFSKILHKKQKEGGFFLDFTPKETYSFLADALNLQDEQKKLAKIDAALQDLEKSKNFKQTQLFGLQSSLIATHESLLSMGLAPVNDITKELILQLKGKYDGSSKIYKDTEQKQKEEIQQLEETRPKVTVSSPDVAEREALESRAKTLTQELNSIGQRESERISIVKSQQSAINLEKSKLNYQVSDAVSARTLAVQLAQEVKKIQDSICPTCEQNWATETAKAKEADLMVKILSCKTKIGAGSIASTRLAEIEIELLDISEQLKSYVDPSLLQIREELVAIELKIKDLKSKEYGYVAAQNASNALILKDFADRQSALRNNHSQIMNQIRGQLDLDSRTLDAAVSKMRNYEEAKVRYETSLESMKVKIVEYQVSLDSTNKELSDIESKLSMAQELKQALKLFISCSFDDALDSIGDAATKIIRGIPSMANATIQFEGQKESKDGKIKEEVNAVISSDGEVGIPIKSLSGGERTAIDLAVDLAVIDMVESSSGIGIDLYILDEAFVGMDSVGIEMALEILKNLDTNKKIIIVDHNELVKAMVSDRIVVVREGTVSRIEKGE